MLRYIVIAAVFVGLALSAPRFMPGLMGTLLDSGGPPVAVAPAEPAALQPQLSPQPAENGGPAEPERPALPEITDRIQYAGGASASVSADAAGHYVAEARINGRAAAAMIDTGASVVALSDATARQLGIFPLRSAYNRPVSTANGVVAAAPVTLSEVRIGAVAVRNVEALVMPAGVLDIDLLGMSFLGRLRKFEASGSRMLLVQ